MRRPATLTSALAVAALGVLSASAQLNPTVKVLPKAQSAIPTECEEGLAPAPPRIQITETEAPQEPAARRVAAPPSIDLRTRLRNVQSAAEQNNRDEFKAALADARASVSGYPLGGERDASSEVLRVYDDLERLWDFSFLSPTGAFFDASTENGALINMMRRYPDYAKFIDDYTLKAGGQIVYPSSETRRFLTAEAARRLARLGVRTPARITEPRPRIVPAPQPTPRLTKPVIATRPAVTKKAAAKPSTKRAKRQPSAKIAEATVTPPQPRRATPTPAPAPAPVPTPAPVTPPPVEKRAPPPTETTATVAPPTATESAPPPATGGTTATSATTTSTPQNAPQRGGGRMNLLFAIILVIVGIGVLIVLFRTAD